MMPARKHFAGMHCAYRFAGSGSKLQTLMQQQVAKRLDTHGCADHECGFRTRYKHCNPVGISKGPRPRTDVRAIAQAPMRARWGRPVLMRLASCWATIFTCPAFHRAISVSLFQTLEGSMCVAPCKALERFLCTLYNARSSLGEPRDLCAR